MGLRDRWEDLKDWASEIDVSESLEAITAGASAGGAVGAIAGGGLASWATAPVLAGIGAGVGLVGSLVDDFGRIGDGSSNPESYYANSPGALASDGFPVSGKAVLNDTFVFDLIEVVKSYYQGDQKGIPDLIKNMVLAKKRGVSFELDESAKSTFMLGVQDIRSTIEVVQKGVEIAKNTDWEAVGSVASSASGLLSRWK